MAFGRALRAPTLAPDPRVMGCYLVGCRHQANLCQAA
jgi:hypothetical protein